MSLLMSSSLWRAGVASATDAIKKLDSVLSIALLCNHIPPLLF